MNGTTLRLKPYLLSKEGFVDAKQAEKTGEEITSEAVRKVVDSPGWLPAVNVFFGAGGVQVVRRNCLGEERCHSSAMLPVSMPLE